MDGPVDYRTLLNGTTNQLHEMEEAGITKSPVKSQGLIRRD